MTLPKEIVATRTFVYNVEDILEDMVTMDMELDKDDVTLDMVIEHIQDWLVDDFGHLYDFNIHLANENGDEL